MKYDRATLRSTALAIKEAWEESIKADHARKVKTHAEALKRWEEKGKATTLDTLQKAVVSVKKGLPIDSYALRNLDYAPQPPEALECCTPKTKELDGLVEFLDTLADDDITATALNTAGFKDMNRLLRRPC